MPAECPFCAQPNAEHVLVCSSCSRDIAIPASLIAERDGLVRKRALVQQELAEAKNELETLRRRQRISLRQG